MDSDPTPIADRPFDSAWGEMSGLIPDSGENGVRIDFGRRGVNGAVDSLVGTRVFYTDL